MKDVMGHLCSIVRLHLTWPSRSSDFPSTAIAKIPNTASLVEKLQGILVDEVQVASAPDDSYLQLIHETEIDTYTMLNKGTRSHCERAGYERDLILPGECEGLAVPFFYGALPFSSPNPCILIEDVHSTKAIDVIDGFDDDKLYKIVDQIVALHVYAFTHDEWEALGEKSVMGEMENTESYQQFVKMNDSMNQNLRSAYPLLSEGLQLLHENYTSNHLWCMEQFRHYKSKVNLKFPFEGVLRTMVHGDLWTSNILWRDNDLAAIVDWATCHPGSLTEDLQRVLVTSCSVERRQRLIRPLLEHYFEKVQMKLREKCKDMPFTFEDLEKDYRRTLPFTCAQTVFALGMWLHTGVLRKGGSDDEARVQEMVARLHSILEETVIAHKWKHTADS
ncbi:hypothetical protein TELCIR_09626 [Teladorsagia circumcincta]|uniref:CHK kinase-like domain-containing protein n=1 Tax=Teladorsagia circumcincta TaxID=45464 RepID=A0A2G9UEE1_TELCI|nr:hypothetical protein TELCIR_09626 [Teladorsagia circumcincta]